MEKQFPLNRGVSKKRFPISLLGGMLAPFFMPGALIFLLMLVTGCVTRQPPKVVQVISGQSIVIMQIKGLPGELSGTDAGRLHVINMESKQFYSWPVQDSGWVVVGVSPGQYLISKYHYEAYYSNYAIGVSTSKTVGINIRCIFSVSQPDTSVYLGAIDLSGPASAISAGINEEAQRIYNSFVPNNQRPLVEGTIHKEQE